VRRFVPATARVFWVRLRGEMLQEFQPPLLQLDDAAAAGSFRLGETPASAHFLERSRDAHGAPLPVDVLPLQGKVLAGACGCSKCNCEDWAISRLHRVLQKAPRLFRGQYPQFAPSPSWQLGTVGRILGQEPPSNRLPHGGA